MTAMEELRSAARASGSVRVPGPGREGCSHPGRGVTGGGSDPEEAVPPLGEGRDVLVGDEVVGRDDHVVLADLVDELLVGVPAFALDALAVGGETTLGDRRLAFVG